MDEHILGEIREYMNTAKKKMGGIFDHFTLTIWVTGRSGPDGQEEDTDYDLVIEPKHNIPSAEMMTFVEQKGLECIPPCFRAARFNLYSTNEYRPDLAFEAAQKAGRQIYFSLRKEYPIKRQLNWPR